jgi:hypothetical protein
MKATPPITLRYADALDLLSGWMGCMVYVTTVPHVGYRRPGALTVAGRLGYARIVTDPERPRLTFQVGEPLAGSSRRRTDWYSCARFDISEHEFERAELRPGGAFDVCEVVCADGQVLRITADVARGPDDDDTRPIAPMPVPLGIGGRS